jgi:prephenate dehydratase
MTPGAADTRSVAYLGPTGTFTEQAIHTQPDLAAMRPLPISSIIEVLRATERGDADFGFVAIENMIEGSVNATIDTLAFDTRLLIQREVIINVNLNLLVQPGVVLGDIERVRSFPVAYAQCRRFLADKLADAPLEATNSTADAARELAESGDRNVAAIAPQRSAEVYGLEVLEAHIEDHPENQTRFVLVGRDTVPPASGHDKTSILVYQKADAPGSLVGILQEFAARRINLTNLQSRPSREGLGDYCFLIDCEGHIADEIVADALRNLHMKTARVKFMGSYPSAYGTDDEKVVNRAGVAEAATWIEELRSRIAH